MTDGPLGQHMKMKMAYLPNNDGALWWELLEDLMTIERPRLADSVACNPTPASVNLKVAPGLGSRFGRLAGPNGFSARFNGIGLAAHK